MRPVDLEDLNTTQYVITFLLHWSIIQVVRPGVLISDLHLLCCALNLPTRMHSLPLGFMEQLISVT